MRRSCLLIALLTLAGCQSSAQKPVLDPFLGRGTVPPPPTGAAVPPYYQGTPAATNGAAPSAFAPPAVNVPPPPSYYNRQSSTSPSAASGPAGGEAWRGRSLADGALNTAEQEMGRLNNAASNGLATARGELDRAAGMADQYATDAAQRANPAVTGAAQRLNSASDSAVQQINTSASNVGRQLSATTGEAERVVRAGYEAEAAAAQSLATDSVYRPGSTGNTLRLRQPASGVIDITSLPRTSTTQSSVGAGTTR